MSLTVEVARVSLTNDDVGRSARLHSDGAQAGGEVQEGVETSDATSRTRPDRTDALCPDAPPTAAHVRHEPRMTTRPGLPWYWLGPC